MNYHVYILQSLKDKKRYVGMTKDLTTRLQEHEKGKVPSTKNRRPLTLIYSEKCNTRTEARMREKYWKSGAGREKSKHLLAL